MLQILCIGIMGSFYGMWFFQSHYMIGSWEVFLYSHSVNPRVEDKLVSIPKKEWFFSCLNLIMKSSLRAVRILSLREVFWSKSPYEGGFFTWTVAKERSLNWIIWRKRNFCIICCLCKNSEESVDQCSFTVTIWVAYGKKLLDILLQKVLLQMVLHHFHN